MREKGERGWVLNDGKNQQGEETPLAICIFYEHLSHIYSPLKTIHFWDLKFEIQFDVDFGDFLSALGT